MKALTICQPYAHLIVTGAKRVENREWPTRYRGPLLIHAGKSRDWLTFGNYGIAEAEMIFGALIGVAQLIDCLHIDSIRDGLHDAKYPWLANHAHTNGSWCFVLENASRFERPIPYKGQLGLFEVPNELARGEAAKVNV